MRFNYSPVMVEWTDAQTIQTQTALEDIGYFDLIPCVTIGFLVYKDKQKIILAAEMWESEGNVKYLHVIPRSIVKKIIKLKEVKK